jgi:hypothetical protein
MQNLELDIDTMKLINKNYNDYLGNLSKISDYIKNFETQMNEQCAHLPFEKEIKRENSSSYEFSYESIEWALCDKSNKWRIFYKKGSYGYHEVSEEKKPLIEWDIQTRSTGAQWLNEFLYAFNEYVNHSLMNSEETLALISGDIPF